MNVSTTSFSPTQMILACTLILLLLSWFFIFTALAIHDYLKKKVEMEDISTSTRPIPIIGGPPQEEHKNIAEMAGSRSPHDLAYQEHLGEQKISRSR